MMGAIDIQACPFQSAVPLTAWFLRHAMLQVSISFNCSMLGTNSKRSVRPNDNSRCNVSTARTIMSGCGVICSRSLSNGGDKL